MPVYDRPFITRSGGGNGGGLTPPANAANRLLYLTPSNQLAPAPIMLDASSETPLMFLAEPNFGSNSINLGSEILSNSFGFLTNINKVNDEEFLVLDQYVPTNAETRKPRRLHLLGPEQPFVLQTDNTTSHTLPHTFQVTTTALERINAFEFEMGADSTNVHFQVRNISPDNVDEVILDWPHQGVWISGSGGSSFSAGVNRIDLGTAKLPFSASRTIEIEIRGTGSILGNSSGIPKLTVYRQLGEFRTLADLDDIGNQDHPVTLRRDIPSAQDSLDLVNASLNNNSAMWIVANDQLTTSNDAHSNATIMAIRTGFLDLQGNTIPQTPVAANTVQLRAGTIVRIFGQNDFRVVNSPVFESDITNPPETPQPSFQLFELEGQPTSVPIGTVISGTKSFRVRVNRPDLLNGFFTIRQDGVVLSENQISVEATSGAITLNEITLSSASNSTTVTIEAQTDGGRTIQSHEIIRAHAAHELAYWGIRQSNDIATVDVSELNQVDVTQEHVFNMTGEVEDGQFVSLVVPATHDVQEITLSGFPALVSFTRTENARVIGSTQYISYVLQSNAGFTTELNAEVTTI